MIEIKSFQQRIVFNFVAINEGSLEAETCNAIWWNITIVYTYFDSKYPTRSSGNRCFHGFFINGNPVFEFHPLDPLQPIMLIMMLMITSL
jgi:hypothetical protein